jgi:hypothetical protein
MRYRLRILRFAAIALLAFPLALLSAPARAQKCNLTDIANTTKNSFSNGWELVKSKDKCVNYFDDYLFWILSGAVGFAEGVSDDAVAACSAIKSAQDKVTGVIDEVKEQKDKVDEYKKDLDNLKGYIDAVRNFINQTKDDSGESEQKKADLDKQQSDFDTKYGEFDAKYKQGEATYQDYLGTAQDLADYLAYVACACVVAEASQGPQFTKILGNCLESGLCAADDWLADNISSEVFAKCSEDPPPPPKVIDCTQDPNEKIMTGFFKWNNSVPYVGSGWVDQKVGVICNGDFCYSEDVIDNKKGNRTFCYCPQAMQKIVPIASDGTIYLQCGCPTDTHAAGTTDTSKYICLCDSTGFPIGPDGVCPKKCACNCPNNQIPVSQGFAQPNGSCACNCGCPAGLTQDGDHCDQPACAGAQEVRISDNSCCAASQVSSCGVCCGAGQKPSADGSCVSASLQGGDTKSRWQKYFDKSLKKSFKP